MAHDVTATKYRPQSFDNLEGQEFVTSALKNSLENKKIANAFLLSGPRGVGKTTTARILAKGLNCINGPTGTPCNVCEFCTSITTGDNSDVIEIDGASNTSINDVKVIQEEILYPPVISRYKVYIIDEVHMLSRNAFNALLKTIEEPPEYVVFIFATTEINEVPATIKSRCQQFNLRLIPADVIYKNLEKVLSDKKISFEPEALKWISSEGHGSMRDAYTLLDQIISFSGNEILLKKIQHKLGIAGEEKIVFLIESIIEKSINSIFTNLNHILECGISPEQLLVEFIKYFRNLLLIKSNVHMKKEIDFDPAYYPDTVTERFTIDDIENILELSFITYEKSRYSIDFKTEIEIFFLKIMKYKDFIRPKQIIHQLNLLQKSILNNAVEISEKKKLTDNSTNAKSFNLPTENKDILKTLKEVISAKEFDLINALDSIDEFQKEDNIISLVFSKQRYYDIANSKINLLGKELSMILNADIKIRVKFEQKQNDSEKNSVSKINKDSITSIFNGIDIN